MATWTLWRGEEAKKLHRQAAIKALVRTAQAVLIPARGQVPLDQGDLRDSGRVVRSRAKNPRVLIMFGGPKAPYAVKWHERPANFRNGRKNRYLADPFNRVAPARMPAEVLRAMREVFP